MVQEQSLIHNSSKNNKITILGGGSFGSALSVFFGRNGHTVCILDRNPHRVSCINNDRIYMKQPGIKVPETVYATTDPESALFDVDYIVHAIPIQETLGYLNNQYPYIPVSICIIFKIYISLFICICYIIQENVPIISVSKGIHAETHMLMDEILEEILGDRNIYMYLSGPSFAKEQSQNVLTTFVLSCKCDITLEQAVKTIFKDDFTHIDTTLDTRGVLMSGACKNAYAIGAGIIQGMDCGYNTLAMFLLIVLQEMSILCTLANSTEPIKTVYLSCGLGDLVLTSFCAPSRNRKLGTQLSKGDINSDIVQDFLKDTVVEGIQTTKGMFYTIYKNIIYIFF